MVDFSSRVTCRSQMQLEPANTSSKAEKDFFSKETNHSALDQPLSITCSSIPSRTASAPIATKTP